MRPGKRTWLWLGAAVFAACGGRAGFEVGDVGDGTYRGGNGGEAGSTTGGMAGTSTGGIATGGIATGGVAGSGFGGAGDVFTGGSGGAGNAPAAGFAGFGGSAVAGQAGAAGQAGSESRLGEPCMVNGALACHGAAQKLALRCDGGFWRANGTCALAANCDQRNGICTPIPPDCTNRAPTQR
ncbi:MAG TPA: hypothetical protein VF103_10575, partial [Polyangiaceae bacterium]